MRFLRDPGTLGEGEEVYRAKEQAAAQGGGDGVRGWSGGGDVTAHAGVVLLVETGRRSGVMEKADRVLPSKKNPKGLGQAQMVESFVLLSALGGECVEDFQSLRADLGLSAMVGYELPAPSTARSFLDRFHDEDALSGRPSQGSFIPRESAGLEGLRELVRQSPRAYFSAAIPAGLLLGGKSRSGSDHGCGRPLRGLGQAGSFDDLRGLSGLRAAHRDLGADGAGAGRSV